MLGLECSCKYGNECVTEAIRKRFALIEAKKAKKKLSLRKKLASTEK